MKIEMPSVPKIPEELEIYSELIVEKLLPSMALVSVQNSGWEPQIMGSTKRDGFDCPVDLSVVSEHSEQHVWLQLNLAEIPEEGRKSDLPKEGLVWVIGEHVRNSEERHEEYVVSAKFYDKPVTETRFKTKLVATKKNKDSLHTMVCLVWSADANLPEDLVFDRHQESLYEDWSQILECPSQVSEWRKSGLRASVDARVGGHLASIQGWGQDNLDIVADIPTDLMDAAHIYLRYSKERGFWANIDTH